ncbi:hypothetical protein N7466_008451 [Penicillium verhagenii]|uniref:uncharacterized protein n=1 Tax=Penicillium verhagenii TaxID=1562060 RepID=UPI0025458831|nr:uncharacterized protein N7466_008451 [Penicillium verhagenii]KAJ5924264.1 hypothetical protein N7466_008451 [Penicillium verhagenii]
MSSIIHKVKDTIAQHKENKAEEKAEKATDNYTGTNENAYESTKSSNHGPHDSKIANEADPRVDSDRSNLNSSTTGSYGQHDSKLANKADPRVDSDLDNRTSHNTSSAVPSTTGAAYGSTGSNFGTGNTYDSNQSSNYGPHDSNLGNAADPRVDSDLDNRGTRNTSTGFGSTGATATGAGVGAGAGYGSTGSNFGTGNTYDSNQSSNFGPHDSSLANSADPRVDSDLDNRGTRNTSTGFGSTGATATGAGVGTGYGSTGSNYGTGNTYDSARSTNHGPHDSNVANEVDPRVDSDRDGRAAHHHSSSGHGAGYAAAGAAAGAGAGYAASHHHNSSTHTPSTGPATSTSGPHSSNLENKADPRVDSDTPNDRYSSSTGPASSTAGPHSNNLENKADPRVDSDRSNDTANATFVGNNSPFDEDVRKGSLGGGGVMHISGNKAPTTTQTFEKSQNEGATGGASAGSSYNAHQKTAGPHSSDTANKLDPRIDSDLDGSKTLGSQRY